MRLVRMSRWARLAVAAVSVLLITLGLPSAQASAATSTNTLGSCSWGAATANLAPGLSTNGVTVYTAFVWINYTGTCLEPEVTAEFVPYLTEGTAGSCWQYPYLLISSDHVACSVDVVMNGWEGVYLAEVQVFD